MELRVGNKYRLGRKIGSGSFGDIYLGKASCARERTSKRARVPRRALPLVAILPLPFSSFTPLFLLFFSEYTEYLAYSTHEKRETPHELVSLPLFSLFHFFLFILPPFAYCFFPFVLFVFFILCHVWMLCIHICMCKNVCIHILCVHMCVNKLFIFKSLYSQVPIFPRARKSLSS